MASTARSRSGASDKRPRKNFDRFMPRNPLISLDSDEEIQGNPRKSNPHNWGFSQRNGQEPRKPKPDRLDHFAARRREEDTPPNPTQSPLVSPRLAGSDPGAHHEAA